VINQGRLQQIGSPRDLYERPENPFVADFIGINNLIPGEVQEINVVEKSIKTQTKVGTLVCAHRDRLKPGDQCLISIRPETASIDPSEEGQKGYNFIVGYVSFAYYMGNTIRYDVEINSGIIFKVDVQNPWEHQLFNIGERVYISFPIKTTLGIPAQ
jgi:ABC-type Fe3+/spermidine/putrescine transport system ATPase subunit